MTDRPLISVMLAVPDAPRAAEWYRRALGAEELWNLGTALVARAVAAGAIAKHEPVRDHAMPWGLHRQGSFIDPYGHCWFVGDLSPLVRHSGVNTR